MFKLAIINPARKDLKKLPPNVRNVMFDALEKIQQNPFDGERLKQDLRSYFKYKVNAGGVAYRIIYEIDIQHGIILPLVIGSRENIYHEARRRLRS